MSDPEKLLILELIQVAERDARRDFQGTTVSNKDKVQASARRFIESSACHMLCEFVGGDAGVIRRRVSQPVEGK